MRFIYCDEYSIMQKQVCLKGGEESSSESSESDSSEEVAGHPEPPQSTLQPTPIDVPNAMEETDSLDGVVSLPTSDSEPSATSLDTNTSPLPDTGGSETSTDIDQLQHMPDSDPSQTSLGTDISRDMQDADPSQDTINTDISHALPPDTEGSQNPVLAGNNFPMSIDGTVTDQPSVSTTTYQVFPEGGTPPMSPDIFGPTSPPVSAAPPQTIPKGTAEVVTGVPACYVIMTTPEPGPPRGDNI